MIYAILSDIHGNMIALNSVLKDMRSFDIQGIIFLGDLIDYGMQSNEVVEYVRKQDEYEIISNLWGNHENAILKSDFSHFSSQRGVNSARYTASILSDNAMEYLNNNLDRNGIYAFSLSDKKCLAVHGSLNDPYWKAIFPNNLEGDYSGYDIVFSGHSHYSHCFTVFYDVDDPQKRNKHAVLFINPGSVGQPRNHNPNAQYALIDIATMSVTLRAVPYDISSATALFNGKTDRFYRDRLIDGI